jgi:hypothetical protein
MHYPNRSKDCSLSGWLRLRVLEFAAFGVTSSNTLKGRAGIGVEGMFDNILVE